MRTFPPHPTCARAMPYLALCAILSACGDQSAAGSGSLSVLLEAEDSIVSGLEAGQSVENIADGWTVTYEKFLITVGDIYLNYATDMSEVAQAPQITVIDLTQTPAAGRTFWTLDPLQEGRWEFHFATPPTSSDAKRDKSVSQADFDDMVKHAWTYLIEGEMHQAAGQSCPPSYLATLRDQQPNGNVSGGNPCYDASTIRFAIGAKVDTTYGPCEVDHVPGVAIAAGTQQSAAITIHGDHLFFNGFPEGNEGGIIRLAQWLADCDLDLDGVVTMNELKSIAPADLPELDDRYQLGGSPITPLINMIDYVRGQLKTQGHFQGEGECPIDGSG